MIKKMLVSSAVVLVFAMVAAVAEDGQAIFDGKCAICHGKDGKGKTKMGEKAGTKDFTDASYLAKVTDAQLLKTLKEGLKDGDKTKMKAYDTILSEAELKAAIAYVRTFAGK